MSDEPTDPRLRLAISDPGATTPRLPDENVTAWSARAVLTSDWYAERIAQARREGAADALREASEITEDWPPEVSPDAPGFTDWLHGRSIAIRRDDA